MSSKAITDEQEETRRGELIVEILGLRIQKKSGRVDTKWGDKTPLGIFRTVKRIVEEGE